MARIVWGIAGSRVYEAGVDRGVLFVADLAGVPWTGLISVEESPAGAEAKAYYIDGQKYLNLATIDEFEATIRAYTYPVEFEQCDGTTQIRPGLFYGQQRRKTFDFSYRTMVGNDTQGATHGYKIHLVYNALATPSGRSATSFANSVEPADFAWGITTKPRQTSGSAPTAHVIVDSRTTHPDVLMFVENILYGTDQSVARMPTPEEVVGLFDTPVFWGVTDNGDGTFLVEGPDTNVQDIGMDMVLINHPSVTVVDEDSFTITY